MKERKAVMEKRGVIGEETGGREEMGREVLVEEGRAKCEEWMDRGELRKGQRVVEGWQAPVASCLEDFRTSSHKNLLPNPVLKQMLTIVYSCCVPYM